MPHTEQAPNPVADIVNVDELNRAHKPNGEFMSNDNLEQINAHQDQIREGLGGFDTVAEKQLADKIANNSEFINADALGRGHRPNGAFMSDYEADQVKAHEDQIREGLGEFDNIAYKQLSDKVAEDERAAEQAPEQVVAEGQEVSRNEVPEADESWAAQTAAFIMNFDQDVRPAQQGEATPDTPEDASVVVDPADGSVSRSPASRSRILNSMLNLKDKAMVTAVKVVSAPSKFRAYNELNDQEKQSRRRLMWGAAVGVIAVAAASKLGVELWQAGNGGGPTIESVDVDSGDVTTVNETVALSETPQAAGAGNALSETPQGGGRSAEQHTVTLKAGETAWSEAAGSLHDGATDAEIDQVKDAILEKNGITEVQATQLPIGTRLEMPDALIEKLNEENMKKAA